MSGVAAMVAAGALPLAGAMAAVVAGRRGGGIAVAVTVGVMAAVLLLVLTVSRDGPVLVAVGGWEAPLGIMLRADGMAVAFLAMSALVMTAVVALARSQFGPPEGRRQGESRASFAFWPLALLLWAALNVVFLSRDLFNLYVGLELLTLAAVALVAIEGKAETIAAAMRYMVVALMGSLLYLLGAALAYAAHGTLDILLLSQRAAAGSTDLVAVSLMTAGLAAKTALFPFHAWLPPAHSGAPAPASAMLSALVPKASFYILMRIWFDATPDLSGAAVLTLLGGLGAIAAIYGSIMALRQARLKLIIAYSTVAQLGYLFFVFPLAGGETAAQPWAAGAWTAAMFHALGHGLAKAAMFLCAGIWIQAVGHDRLDGMRGLVRVMPMTVFAFALAAITLMGLPPSAGFTAKYLMLTAAFASGQVVWAAVLLAGGLLAAAYLYRPLAPAFAREIPEGLAAVPRWRQAVPLVLAGAAILLGIASAPPFDFLQIGRPEAAEEGLE